MKQISEVTKHLTLYKYKSSTNIAQTFLSYIIENIVSVYAEKNTFNDINIYTEILLTLLKTFKNLPIMTSRSHVRTKEHEENETTR